MAHEMPIKRINKIILETRLEQGKIVGIKEASRRNSVPQSIISGQATESNLPLEYEGNYDISF